MSASEPPEDPNAWDPDDTSAVPVGPEPEPTGAGGGGGAGGWGRAPRVEPFAIAALVWAVVSIVIPLVGTIVAFVLAARAADLIRRSRGEKSGAQYVAAARIVAGGVLALWIIGLVGFLALRDGDSNNDNVAVPTQPPATTIAPASTTTTTPPLTTTTTKPPVTTKTVPPPTITVVPPPPTTVAPTTAAPPPTTVAPTTAPATTSKPPSSTTSTKPVTTTTSPDQRKAAKVHAGLLVSPGGSNRDVPADQRFVVTYTPGKNLLVTWAINDGDTGDKPTGTPTCTTPPTAPAPTTPTEPGPTTPSEPPPSTSPERTTQEQARYEAQQILATVKKQVKRQNLNVTGVQLVGTFPIEGTAESTVVQVLYSKATITAGISDYLKAFEVPPAEAVQCLNPAFELS
jgi:outer membrane biosynthesis protein TonB